MSFQVTNAHRVTYQNNVELALQQKKSKLATPETMLWGGLAGEKEKIKDLIGAAKPQRNRTRHGDTQYNNTPHDGRWIAMKDEYYYADLIDKADRLLAPGIDIQGGYTTTAAATMVRSADDEFLEGFYGTALVGKTGATVVPFKAGNIIPVNTGSAAATGLNIPKLRAALAMFMANLVDTEDDPLFMAISSKQLDNLLSELQATSNEFTSRQDEPVLMNGKLRKLLRFNFVECEFGNSNSFDNAYLTVDANGNRRVPAWTKSGMYMGEASGIETTIDRLPGKNNSVQVRAGRFISASRTDEDKVLQVLCAE